MLSSCLLTFGTHLPDFGVSAVCRLLKASKNLDDKCIQFESDAKDVSLIVQYSICGMSYRVTDLSGICGILIARKAASLAGLDRTEQLNFYKKCDRVLPPLKFTAYRLQADGSERAPLHKEVTASHVLAKCKLLVEAVFFFLLLYT